jgi:hypothetical protein
LTKKIDEKIFIFKLKKIYFSDYPHDVDGCDAVVFPFFKNKVDIEGFTVVESPTAVIDLTQDLDTIWKNMDRKSTRYSINRARRDGIKIRINKDYAEFYQIYGALMQRKGFGSSFGIGTPKLRTMERYGTLFTAECDGEILGGHLYLEDDDNILLWISASKRLEVDRNKARLIGNANRLLHWEAIKYAGEKGIREFDWGGLWASDEADKDERKRSVNSFKLSFGGEAMIRYSYRKVYSGVYKIGSYLYNIMREIGKGES